MTQNAKEMVDHLKADPNKQVDVVHMMGEVLLHSFPFSSLLSLYLLLLFVISIEYTNFLTGHIEDFD